MLKVCPYKCKESSDLNFRGKLKAIHSIYLIINIVWYFQKKCDIDIYTIFWKWFDNCLTIYRQTIFWGPVQSIGKLLDLKGKLGDKNTNALENSCLTGPRPALLLRLVSSSYSSSRSLLPQQNSGHCPYQLGIWCHSLLELSSLNLRYRCLPPQT